MMCLKDGDKLCKPCLTRTEIEKALSEMSLPELVDLLCEVTEQITPRAMELS